MFEQVWTNPNVSSTHRHGFRPRLVAGHGLTYSNYEWTLVNLTLTHTFIECILGGTKCTGWSRNEGPSFQLRLAGWSISRTFDRGISHKSFFGSVHCGATRLERRTTVELTVNVIVHRQLLRVSRGIVGVTRHVCTSFLDCSTRRSLHLFHPLYTGTPMIQTELLPIPGSDGPVSRRPSPDTVSIFPFNGLRLLVIV